MEALELRREEGNVLEERVRVDEVRPRAHCVAKALQTKVDLLDLRV